MVWDGVDGLCVMIMEEEYTNRYIINHIESCYEKQHHSWVVSPEVVQWIVNIARN